VLADMIGTTRSRVSIFMNKFRRLSFIDYDDIIEVRSSLLYVVLQDQTETAPIRGRSLLAVNSRKQTTLRADIAR